ncbi:ABC transporter substrate-binding protein [Clostridium polynesiense]|uniref:ABC transporter substrate-binding protein n=1 Tax=Clostridium polynesiense TaxID=1325933 RepID=UPI00058D330B|nr:ABC transporter substrate-binding protein [Clostridium polynesiense]
MKKKLLSLILAASMVTMITAGCSGSNDNSGAKGGGTTELIFWHSMGGAGGEAISKMVEDFNKSQDKIKVNAEYQGSYDDAINKMKSSQQGNAGPDIMQLYDIGTRWMIDSGYAVPMQQFIDEDKFDISSLEKNILGYYTVNDKLYSMPFNSSTPILYYNKDAFKEAGLDPEKAPKTMKELQEISAKLTKKEGDKVSRYGYSMAVYGWFFEQFAAKQGLAFANNENGRKDKATAVEFDKNGAGLNIFKMWKELYDTGNAGNYGRKTADTQNAFNAGKTAMMIDSTAVLNSIIKGTNGKFEVGTAFLPSINEGDKGGVSIGGGSLWILDNKDKEKGKAAWEFIKFMVSPEQQVYWHKSTGYFPITQKAYDLPEMKEHLKKYPQFQTAIDQLHASTVESRGALLGVFPQARQVIETEIEGLLQNKSTPEQAVEKAASTINTALEKYNKSNK